MVLNELAELRPYGPPTSTQGLRDWTHPRIKLPIVGYYDYEWANKGILIDLKTTERCPSEIKVSHARQVALYCTSDNMSARLTYVTPVKRATYRLENINAHRAALLNMAVTVENFLSLSDDPEFFLKIVAPDLESFYWATPEARALAFRYWGI